MTETLNAMDLTQFTFWDDHATITTHGPVVTGLAEQWREIIGINVIEGGGFRESKDLQVVAMTLA